MSTNLSTTSLASGLFLATLCLGSGGCSLFTGNGEATGKRRDLIQHINSARSESRLCGATAFTATTPVAWNELLADAALRHVEDMAAHNFAGHQGSDGSVPGRRIQETGYAALAVGEVVAVGDLSIDELMQRWLDSPGHCATIMNPAFVDAGGAGLGGYIWTVDFGAPF